VRHLKCSDHPDVVIEHDNCTKSPRAYVATIGGWGPF
jgi:hypothetical protein